MKMISIAKTTMALGVLLWSMYAQANVRIEFNDPRGDDKGPGKYTYPTHSSYQAGDFDLTRVTITQKGDNVEFRVWMRNTIRDVWKSRSWGGNGFSVQFVQIYIRTTGGGHSDGLPGLNVKFAKGHRWNKVVLLSPQGQTRLRSEINLKAAKWKKDIVVPTDTRAQGKSLIATVPQSALGGLSKKWGFQVIVQSNEGFPRKTDLLTRPVNEYNGEHRFGGGHDGDCDPHIIDMLAGKGKGSDIEAELQYKMLSAHVCEGKAKLAKIKMVYAE